MSSQKKLETAVRMEIDNNADQIDLKSETKTAAEEERSSTVEDLEICLNDSDEISPPFQSENSSPREQISDKNVLSKLRKDRVQMVYTMAGELLAASESYSGRTRKANMAREKMWKHISEKVNDEFSGTLDGLSPVQTRKLFSNSRRKSRATHDRSSRGSSSTLDEEGDSPSSDSPKKIKGFIRLRKPNVKRAGDKVPKIESDVIPEEPRASEEAFESVVALPQDRPQDDFSSLSDDVTSWTSMELSQLKKSLEQKDAEIDLLKMRIAQQSEEYRNHMKMAFDFVGAVVDQKATDDVRKILTMD